MNAARLPCIIACAALLGGCPKVYEVTPDLEDSFAGIPLNGGRTHAVTVNPNNRRHIIVATQFGGMWKTVNGGRRWHHVGSLPAVFARDVQFAPDGRTVVATLARDNQATNGGGIYVSRDAGSTWSRPPTGVIPTDARTPDRGSAHGIDFARDEPETWYVGTDFGIARSIDNGASWEHVKVDDSDPVNAFQDQDTAFSVLALEEGVVLAMLNGGVYRSDNRGGMWDEIRAEFFGFYSGMGFNKMDRERRGSGAFILKDYSTLYYYEPDADRWTTLQLPEGGGSRSPFVRVSKAPVIDLPFGQELDLFPWYSTIWVGQGVRAIAALTLSPATTRALDPTDWVVHGRGDGIHDDTGDLGVAGDLRPIMMGTDGGVFQPRSGQITSWKSGAPDGSRFNSLQITDLAGTNTVEADPDTTLYFSTQDNGIWSSEDNGRSWPQSDCAEGFHIEVRETAPAVAPITVGYGKIGCGPSGQMYSDAFLQNQRAVPNAEAGGGTLDAMFEAFYLQAGRWIRTRAGDAGAGRNAGIYVSSNGGDSWRRRYDLGVVPYGVYRRTNVQFPAANMSAYLPVNFGQSNADGSPRVGLIRMNSLFDNRVDSFGTADVMQLPDSGSLGTRATEFDWQIVYGVHPHNAEFIIAPDIVNQQVRMTRDGGDTWTGNLSLTRAVTQGGKYLLWDGNPYRMQVTHISYDPYDDDRILVGTRDAGVICSRDGGVSWRTIRGTEPIRYITGFQFQPNGSLLVSAYGRGLWRIRPQRASCETGIEWTFDIDIEDLPEELRPWQPWSDYRTRQVALEEPDDDAARQPRGIDRPEIPLLFGQSSPRSAGDVVLDESNLLTIRGRGFDGASRAPLLAYLDGAAEPFTELGLPDAQGGFIAEIRLPAELPFGRHRLDVRQRGAGEQYRSSIWFRKVHLDEHLGDEPAPSQFEQGNAWEEPARRLYETVKRSGELEKIKGAAGENLQ